MAEIVVVTGMSGAGRMSCLKILEDLGYEAVDNLPVNLLGRVVRGDETRSRPAGDRPRQPYAWFRACAAARGAGRIAARAVRPACCSSSATTRCCGGDSPRRAAVIRWPTRRAWSTRWRPSAELMAPLKAAADMLIDTSDLSLPDLRRLFDRPFRRRPGPAFDRRDVVRLPQWLAA